MDQLAKLKTSFGKGCAALLGVLAAVVTVGVGNANASGLKSKAASQAGQQTAMLGEPFRDGELKEKRGTAPGAPAPDASVQPSGGYAVILWDETGQGKPGGGTTGMTGNVGLTVTVNG